MRDHVLVLAALAAVLVPSTADAGPVFDTIGASPLTLPHPSGVGTRVGSLFWGISTTGTGFVDGRLIFEDAFALPASPGDSVAFDETDLHRVEFSHVTTALPGGGAIAPVFSFTAGAPGDAGQITAASGSVVHGGTATMPVYTLFLPTVTTSTPGTQPVLLGGGLSGLWSGTWGVSGVSPQLQNATRSAADTPITIGLVINSQFDGGWRMTGFQPIAPVPEPSSAALVGIGIAGLAFRRRRARRRR